ncbi:glycosyltransferase family 4 protein [Mangrovibrevibacter kandeliae]|uniref:glycosyltransferase family 4 protein n=1 Tax=Mangrovibrevibacter kandeliae TaxID=2968473 RepID=UPI002118F29E|nr:glycosyltransferase family 1 protein [Aurantimonas sp. CSK15Z-1]MCQ8782799.1 glycosyltransferase family 1 protein [Aurantimonas sp. CSK15Z-1]
MRCLIATDAWYPQINGVVRTLTSLADQLRARGIEVRVVSPQDFVTVPCPTYPQIRLALARSSRLAEIIEAFDPDSLHIATEGPIGFAARRAAIRAGRRFTTSFHTRFPEYLRQRAPIPEPFTYALLRRFHSPAAACLVPTEGMRRDLGRRGFDNLVTWTRGVDRSTFRPIEPVPLDLAGPIFLTVSRIAPEKNLEGFLDLDLPGSKVVVGDGPKLEEMRRRYPKVHFAGAKVGEDLTRYYCAADVFVFPSRTDTFGIVLIEALACGVPIAAFHEPGPVDVIGTSAAGAMSDDLREACLRALTLSREAALARSQLFSWEACADIFLETFNRHLPGVRNTSSAAG